MPPDITLWHCFFSICAKEWAQIFEPLRGSKDSFRMFNKFTSFFSSLYPQLFRELDDVLTHLGQAALPSGPGQWIETILAAMKVMLVSPVDEHVQSGCTSWRKCGGRGDGPVFVDLSNWFNSQTEPLLLTSPQNECVGLDTRLRRDPSFFKDQNFSPMTSVSD